ncbi:cannabinoid receptor type 1B-like [Aplysia californica]|uniref:Cannabinoid receptor type 1B-like n=1 Tax=Aplysia californica TaxID=6500 RepID=A0ABM0KAV7_APLCA|nr:cannabinoid receptor type 1B-like [Aplysia californica]
MNTTPVVRSNGSVTPPSSSELPEDLLQLLQYILILGVALPSSFIGCVTNVLNIIVIARMDWKQTINISLFALAVSDLVGLLGLIWFCICFSPWLQQAENLSFIPREIGIATGSWVHLVFARITGYLTFLISAERCLCILFPMKIKTMITPRRIKAIVVGIFIWGIGIQYLSILTYEIGWKFSEEKNKTLLGVLYREIGIDIELPVVMTNNVMSQYVTFVGVVAFTAILANRLKRQSKWRQSSSQTAASEVSTKRDMRIVKTVSVISAVYIVCYFPNTISFSCLLIVPGYGLYGRYGMLLDFVTVCAYVLEVFNSSINTFLYWTFMVQYRSELRRLLKYCRPSSTQPSSQ